LAEKVNCKFPYLVQQRISRLIALVVLGTKYLSATPLSSKAVSTAPDLTQLNSPEFNRVELGRAL